VILSSGLTDIVRFGQVDPDLDRVRWDWRAGGRVDDVGRASTDGHDAAARTDSAIMSAVWTRRADRATAELRRVGSVG